MKILVTGATGFVGKHLIQKLRDFDVRFVVRNINTEYSKDRQIVYNDEKLDVFQKDVKSYNPKIVIHLASYLTSSDDISSIKNIVDSNILFTSILLESLKSTDLELFINTGTFAEYYYNDGKENPAYFYSASKIAIKPIIKYFKNIQGFKTINIIPYTIYGGKSKSKKVIDYILDSLDSKLYLEMTNGEQILDFIHIEDVTDFYVHCVNNINLLKDEEDYHLGTGKGTSIKGLSNIIEDLTNKKANINWGSKEYRTLDIMRAIAPIYKLEKELNWKPKVSIKDGIKKILEEEK
ncbi:MAG: NAD(P)-dependent oxidoreductase [Aliarcobacter skirrowii]|uniref:NAD-dependent epimerase/dehydratase family protein n=1 Tax=Aliarcobacter skirrowii TaxID=28200 RepID=UPI00242F37C6|nr:NAD(P)-dependent oxidoreductase [Aliarcobacter skirrowii]MDD2509027.1 NAD(P)-dependent oxidoreductase [Aliarcobacter skirrowii]MDD3497024.1 NAD(P)-dependent oxidoreductase [Aliarcobacter skirrowii]